MNQVVCLQDGERETTVEPNKPSIRLHSEQSSPLAVGLFGGGSIGEIDSKRAIAIGVRKERNKILHSRHNPAVDKGRESVSLESQLVSESVHARRRVYATQPRESPESS